MNIRKLIREEIARNIPYEHKLEALVDTNFKSGLHLGGKPFTAKDMDIKNRYPWIKPVKNVASAEYHDRIKRSNKTERQKDFDKFMEESVGGGLSRSMVFNAPRLDVLMCGAVLLEFKVNKVFKDVNNNHVFHVALDHRTDLKVDGDKKKHNNTGVSIYSKSNATQSERKMQEALGKFNEVFGTAYFIDVSYHRELEDVFLVRSGKVDTKGKPLSYGQYLDFDAVIAEQKAILKVWEDAQGSKSILDDDTPWRCITEFGKDKG